MGFIRYKQKKENIVKLEKYLKYVDRKQYMERNDKLQNKKNK
jgi:hypothetical protein